MTIENFVIKICGTYRDDKNQEANETFRDFLYSFCEKINLNDYQKLFDYVSMNYKYKSPPKPYFFWNYARENGLLPESQGESGVSWRVCDNGHKYENKGTCCPICGSYFFKIGTDPETMPGDVKLIQESCSQCNWFAESLSGPTNGLYGPECQEYGTEKCGKVKDYCNRCKCKDCCHMSLLSHTNPDVYREVFGYLLLKKFKDLGEHVSNLSKNNDHKYSNVNKRAVEAQNQKVEQFKSYDDKK